MKNEKVFISIILPVYNPNRIEKAFDSLEMQDDKSIFEVIIVNDAGSREFEKLLPKYSFNYTLIENGTNVGQGLARQIGMDACHGEWVTFLDHDDELVPNCLSIVKRGIEDYKCEFVFSTQSIISNGEDWITTGEYIVEDSGAVLHGHFYNMDKIRKYDIHFTDKVRAQEDTFFLALVSGNMLLDKENYNPQTTEVKCQLITYKWYLWKDSTSHSYSKYKNGMITYLENTLDEYITAVWTAYELVRDRYPYDTNFTHIKCMSLLMYLYWFEQSFRYDNPNGWKRENVVHIRNIVNKIIEELNLESREKLIELLMTMPDLYYVTYNAMLTNVDGVFIPQETVEQFFRNI